MKNKLLRLFNENTEKFVVTMLEIENYEAFSKKEQHEIRKVMI